MEDERLQKRVISDGSATYSSMSILNFGIISLKPHGLSYSFLNMALIELILILIMFGDFNEIALFRKSRYNLIVHFLIHTQENWQSTNS